MDASLKPFLSATLQRHISPQHGFFTRQGGHGSGLYDSFNTSLDKKDAPETVHKNHQRLAAHFHTTPKYLCFLAQTHSNTAVFVEGATAPTQAPKADALITKTPGLVLCVQTADCVPLLLYDPSATMIAAIHGGWKGLLAGIIPNTLTLMKDHGANPAHILASIGPSIFQESYEIGVDVRESFLAKSQDTELYMIPSDNNGKFLLDLRTLASDQLKAGGISPSAIDSIPFDTYPNADLFFSCRRATHKGEPTFGNQVSCIRL